MRRSGGGRISQRLGAIGEDQAISALTRVGVEMIEEIGTPVILSPVRPAQNVFKVTFKKKVAGDHRGIAKGGISVLAEVKTAFGRNLIWSNLEEHQPEALKRHRELGGVSLLVWVTDNGVHVMHFPIDGFGPGKGLTKEKAEAIAINTPEELLGLPRKWINETNN